MDSIEVLFFMDDGTFKELKYFHVSRDRSLFYRTVWSARNYGEQKGYDKFTIFGDEYEVRGVTASELYAPEGTRREA